MEMIQAVKLLYTLKMKSLTLFFSLFLMLPLSVFAQSAGELLQKVSEALSEGKDDYAVSLFRQSQMPVWTRRKCSIGPMLTRTLW